MPSFLWKFVFFFHPRGFLRVIFWLLQFLFEFPDKLQQTQRCKLLPSSFLDIARSELKYRSSYAYTQETYVLTKFKTRQKRCKNIKNIVFDKNSDFQDGIST